jgi:hypothetical protein
MARPLVANVGGGRQISRESANKSVFNTQSGTADKEQSSSFRRELMTSYNTRRACYEMLRSTPDSSVK